MVNPWSRAVVFSVFLVVFSGLPAFARLAADINESACLLQKGLTKSTIAASEPAGHNFDGLLAYYTGRAPKTVPRPMLDSHILAAHGHAEPLPAERVASLLEVGNHTISRAHPTRFFADGVLSEDACRRLRAMFDRNRVEMKTAHNQFFKLDPMHFSHANQGSDFMASTLHAFVHDPDFPLLLALRQRMLENVRERLEDSRASQDFTHFIHRIGHSKNEGMGTHADNCQFGHDGKCHKSAQCCAWRSHTVFTYLSDENVDGGEFYFSRQGTIDRSSKDLEMTVAPRCGQMVGFSSGGENPHGVLPLPRGNRYSLGMWLTDDPKHFEYVSNT